MSEEFGPQWKMLVFYTSIEKKSVYEAEDMVLDRLGDADGDASSGALKHLPYRTTLGLGDSADVASGSSLHRSESPSVREDARVHEAFLREADGLFG